MTSPDSSDYLFYITTAQGGVIRSLFETLKDILHDVSIIVDDTGIRVLTTDGIKQMLMWLRLDAERFERFEIAGAAAPYRLGVNISSLFKLLRIATARDTVSFYMEKKKPDSLGIKISNADNKTSTNFSMKLLDVNFTEISVPAVTFEATASMPSAYFQRLCRDMGNIGQYLNIRVAGDGGQLTLSCAGDFASQETEIRPIVDNKHCVTITRHDGGGDDIQGSYSLKFLSLFNKASALSPNIELYFKKNYPLVMCFTISSLGDLRFALAHSAPPPSAADQ